MITEPQADSIVGFIMSDVEYVCAYDIARTDAIFTFGGESDEGVLLITIRAELNDIEDIGGNGWSEVLDMVLTNMRGYGYDSARISDDDEGAGVFYVTVNADEAWTVNFPFIENP